MSHISCGNCKFRNLGLMHEPCQGCDDHNHWEAQSAHPERMAEPQPTNDNVNHPAHYTQGGIECIDAIKAAVVGLTGIEAVCTGQVIKYIWRWKHKNGIEDLRKAEWYLHRLMQELERDGG